MPSLKQLLKSKTVWAGALTTVAGVAQYAMPFIPPQYTAIALAASGLITAGLRTLTNKPLSEK